MKEQPQKIKEKGICIVAPMGRNVIGSLANIYGDILLKNGFSIIKVDSTPMLRIKALFDLFKLRDKYEYIHVHSSGYLGDIRLLWAYIVSKIFKKVTTKLPLTILYYLCFMGAPIFSIIKTILTILKIGEYPKRTWRENTVSLFDTYSPEYAHHHTIGEVFAWFQKVGFCNITLTDKNLSGFGVCGDRKIQKWSREFFDE